MGRKKRTNSRTANLLERLGRAPKPSRCDRVIGRLLPKYHGILYAMGMGRRRGRRVLLTNTAERRAHLLQAGESLENGLEQVGGTADIIMVRGRTGRKILEIPAKIVLEKSQNEG